jgi:hypothetical protein
MFLKQSGYFIKQSVNEYPDEEQLKRLYVVGKHVSVDESLIKDAPQEEEANVYTDEAMMTLASKAKREVLRRIQTQSALKELPGSKTQLGTIVVWLDAIQQEIMKDPTKRQVIVGPASTGKTLLIQLKVLEIIEETKSKVLIILPYKQLEEKYKEFLKNATDIDTSKEVKFVTPETQNWKRLLEENKTSHWFVDEFAALYAGHKELSNQILTLSR